MKTHNISMFFGGLRFENQKRGKHPTAICHSNFMIFHANLESKTKKE